MMASRSQPLPLAVVALLLSGCGVVQFDVHEAGDAQIPGCQGLQCVLGQFGFGSLLSMDLSQSQEWQNNNATKDKVTSASLTALGLDVTQPDGGDLSFLKSLAFSVSAPDAGTAVVADGTSFPAGQSHVDLTAHPDVDLTPYVKASSMTLTTQAQGNQPTQDTTIRARVTFHIKL